MRFQRVLVAATAAVLAGGLGLAGATTASAATADPAATTVGCLTNTNGALDLTVSGAVGDTFTLTSSGGFCWVASASGTYAASSFDGYTGIVTVAGTTPSSGADVFNSTATFTIVGPGSFTIGHGTGIAFTSTITVVTSGTAASGPDLTPWLQGYARASQDEACADGYSTSWAQWPNDGQGGWVCVKTTRKYLS